LKVALVHYWLVGMRGGEKVLECLCELFPEADIFTLVVDRGALSESILRHRIESSWLQRIGGRKHYKKMLPLMPMALESFDLTAYDLVISSEAGPAKGVITGPTSLHICYCHSPMRYIWDLYYQYRAQAPWLARTVMSLTSSRLRQWDVTTAARVDFFIANSRYVAKRVKKFYRRDSKVINPPVDLDRFSISGAPGEYYLCAGQITPNKRIDLAVEAFTRLGLPLVVIGEGADRSLRKSAGQNVTFLGAVDDEQMVRHFSSCKALVFPGIEDFGIVPLEVMASGRPVIAYAEGGALETVLPGKTGILFDEQSVQAVIQAVMKMESEMHLYEPQRLREFASGFDRNHFKDRMRAYIDECISSSNG
jgi:glycosyltransferase involved in cell wall biosynthesis